MGHYSAGPYSSWIILDYTGKLIYLKIDELSSFVKFYLRSGPSNLGQPGGSGGPASIAGISTG
jgi:hypothetical protein